MTKQDNNRMAKLAEYISKWGINLCFYDDERPKITDSGPRCASLNLDTQTIFCPANAGVTYAIGNILHELSHLLTPELPENADELYGPMLALDWAHHQFLSEIVAYNEMMSDFQCDQETMETSSNPYGTWPDLSRERRNELLEMSKVKAMHIGLLSDWTPTFNRDSATMETLRECMPSAAVK